MWLIGSMFETLTSFVLRKWPNRLHRGFIGHFDQNGSRLEDALD